VFFDKRFIFNIFLKVFFFLGYFKIFKPFKAFLIFFYQIITFKKNIGFLSVKSTFKFIKRNYKHALSGGVRSN
jgi:hypothetical protein